MSQLKAVVFDVGNILIRWDPDAVLSTYFAMQADYARFLDETRLMWMNLEFDAGLPFAKGISELTSRFPHYEAPLRAFDERWSECVPGAIEANLSLIHI